MKHYPEYKDSGIEWIGEMPSHWDKKKLKYLVKNCIDKSINNEEFKIALENIESNTGKFIDSNGKEFEVFSGEGKKFKKNDVLFNKLRPYLSKVYLASRDGACVGEFLVLKPLESLNSNFLFWRLLSDEFIKEINSSTYGAKMPRASWEFIGNLELPYPSKNEQKILASYLDFKTKQIDSLILKKSKLIELLKEQRAAMINRAVTKGLNPHAPLKDSGIEWLGKIPEHWEIKKLKFISEITLGKMLTPMDKGGMLKKPYLRAKNLNWLNVDLTDIKNMWFSKKELTQYLLKRGDLLVSEGGEVGRTCMWNEDYFECYIQNSVNRVRFNNLKYNPKYFLYLFFIYGKMGHFDAIVSRVSIAHLTKEKLADVYIIIPTLVEQNYIVAHIDKELIKINKNIKKIEREIELLKEYKTALISEAVTGKIDVRDFGPYKTNSR